MFETSYGKVGVDVLSWLQGKQQISEQPMMMTADLTLKKLLVTVSPKISAYALTKFIEMFLEDTYRVKGFVRTAEGLMLVDCVGNLAKVEPFGGQVDAEKVGRLVVLSGEGMPVRTAVQQAAGWYPDYILKIE